MHELSYLKITIKKELIYKQQNIKNCTHSSNVLALKSPIGNILILLILLIIVIIALCIIKDM